MTTKSPFRFDRVGKIDGGYNLVPTGRRKPWERGCRDYSYCRIGKFYQLLPSELPRDFDPIDPKVRAKMTGIVNTVY